MGGISIDQVNHPVVTWRGVVVCKHSVPKLEAWAKSLGQAIRLTPLAGCGSYQTSTVASAGTHAGGGAIDVDLRYVPSSQRAWVANQGRLVGLQISWHRDLINGLWTWHCHALDPECTKLSSAAVGQVLECFAGGDGLVGTTPDRNVRTNIPQLRGIYANRGKTPTPAPTPTPAKPPAPVRVDYNKPTGNFPWPKAGCYYGPSTPGKPWFSGKVAGALSRATIQTNIKKVQRMVGAYADGLYGAKTTAAVKKWQSAHKLSADGIVGPTTWGAMVKANHY